MDSNFTNVLPIFPESQTAGNSESENNSIKFDCSRIKFVFGDMDENVLDIRNIKDIC